MKNLKIITALFLAMLILTSCASNLEIGSSNEGLSDEDPKITIVTDISDNSVKTETPKTSSKIEVSKPPITTTVIETSVVTDFTKKTTTGNSSKITEPDRIKWETTDSKLVSVLDNMVENYKNEIVLHNIISGVAIEIIYEDYDVRYLFKVTDNITGNELSEYITVASSDGDILELGKEYVVSPRHNNSTLWDVHFIYLYYTIPRELLSERDIETIRKNTANAPTSVNTVIENASTSSKFISSVDIAVELTVTSKEYNIYSDKVISITYELNEILSGKDYADKLSNSVLINYDVEVGETYIVMFEVVNDSYVRPAARKGAVVSKKSSSYRNYANAFSQVTAIR